MANTSFIINKLNDVICAIRSLATSNTPEEHNVEICMIDNVNNDFTLLKPYIKLVSVNPTTGVVTEIGNYDYNYNSYTPLFPLLASSVGTTPVLKQGRTRLLSGTWSPTALMKSYTIRVKTAATLPPTFTDSFLETTLLEQGETLTFGNDTDLMDITPVLTITTGSEVFVNYITF